MKHTKGPWFFSKLQGLTISAHSNTEGAPEHSICTWHTSERTEQQDLANAYLIKAAPAMLEALEEIVANYGSYSDEERPGFISLAIEVIREAKGK